MVTSIYESMKHYVEHTLSGKWLDLLSISEGESTNKETGDAKKFIRLEVEVPKGLGNFSRCRFKVKVPEAKLLVSSESLAKSDFQVAFKGLTISYIDDRKTVYFRADEYQVKKEES